METIRTQRRADAAPDTDRVSYHTGDIKREHAFANPVNLVGIMGAGLARQVQDRWPAILGPYRRACRSGQLTCGQVQAFRRPDGGWVINTPTKHHWRRAVGHGPRHGIHRGPRHRGRTP